MMRMERVSGWRISRATSQCLSTRLEFVVRLFYCKIIPIGGYNVLFCINKLKLTLFKLLLTTNKYRLHWNILWDSRAYALNPSICVSCIFYHINANVLKSIERLFLPFLYTVYNLPTHCRLEILAFPFENKAIDISKCREDILSTEKKGGNKIHIMEAVEINGEKTHPIFKYLKKLFDMEEMDPNFSHYL